MSLATLLNMHKFSVQTSIDPIENADGSIDRWSSVVIEAWNKPGHIQRMSRDKAIFKYNIREYEGMFLLYFQDSMVLETWHRILTHFDPRKKLQQCDIDAHLKEAPTLRIMEFMGFADEVFHPSIQYRTAILRSINRFDIES